MGTPHLCHLTSRKYRMRTKTFGFRSPNRSTFASMSNARTSNKVKSRWPTISIWLRWTECSRRPPKTCVKSFLIIRNRRKCPCHWKKLSRCRRRSTSATNSLNKSSSSNRGPTFRRRVSVSETWAKTSTPFTQCSFSSSRVWSAKWDMCQMTCWTTRKWRSFLRKYRRSHS